MVKKMTDEQQEFLNAEGKVVIKACPGSGKTYTVAHKLLSYVDNWKDYHSGVAVLSFTNVASNEIYEKAQSIHGSLGKLGYPQKSYRNKKKKTQLYYCHPYRSSERASNENQNRMVRRHVPKGTNFDNMTRTEVKDIESWINDYPRKLFGGLSAREVYEKEIFGLIQEDTA